MFTVNIRDFNGFYFEKDLVSGDGNQIVATFFWSPGISDFVSNYKVLEGKKGLKGKKVHDCSSLEEAIEKYNSLS
jgi:hypothetical protein